MKTLSQRHDQDWGACRDAMVLGLIRCRPIIQGYMDGPRRPVSRNRCYRNIRQGSQDHSWPMDKKLGKMVQIDRQKSSNIRIELEMNLEK